MALSLPACCRCFTEHLYCSCITDAVAHVPSALLCLWKARWLHFEYSPSSLSWNFKKPIWHVYCFRGGETTIIAFQVQNGSWVMPITRLWRWHLLVLQDTWPYGISLIWSRVWCLLALLCHWIQCHFELMSKSYPTIIQLYLILVTKFTTWLRWLTATSRVRFLYCKSGELMVIDGLILLIILIIPTSLM